MSRIVRGNSEEVKTIRIVKNRDVQPTEYAGTSFQTAQIEGTVSLAELDERVRAATQEGFQQGAQEAEKKMAGPLRAALQNIEAVLDELTRFRRELFKEAESEILELIRAVAKRVIVREVKLDPETLKGIVEKGLEILEKEKKVVLEINPSDYQFYTKAKPDFMEKFKGIEELEIMTDSQVPAGSVLLNSKTVQLDMNLEAMVDHLMNEITSQKSGPVDINDEGDKA